MNNLIIALFDRPQQADAVREELISEGFSQESISVMCEPPLNQKLGGMGRSLLNCFGDEFADQSRTCIAIYDQPAQVLRAAQIIERHQPLDVKKRAEAA